MTCGRHEGSPRKRGTRQPAGCRMRAGNAEGSGLGQIPGRQRMDQKEVVSFLKALEHWSKELGFVLFFS